MRIGVVSDIHCNAAALRHAFSLLEDVDEVFCLGDSINEYQFSDEVVHLLRVNKVETIQGNHEWVYFSAAGAGGRTQSAIDHADKRWLAARPSRKLLRRCGRRLLLVHSTPWDSGHAYITPAHHHFQRFGDTGADFVLYGHTHEPVVKRIGECVVVNPGSLGQARLMDDGRLEQSFAIVDLCARRAEIVSFPEERSPLRPAPSNQRF